MARGSKPPTRDPKKDLPPTFKMWLEEHWTGWLRPVAVILLLLGGYLAYDRQVLGPDRSESTFGVLVVALIIGGTILAAVTPLFAQLIKREHKVLLGLFVAAWAVGAGYPSLRRVFPAASLGEPVNVGYCTKWKDPEHRECSDEAKTATAKIDKGSAPYEIDVSGELAGGGDVEANWSLDLTGADGSKDHVEGVLSRSSWHQRTSRRGAGGRMVQSENTEESRRLTLHGNEVKIEADVNTDRLLHGLTVSFHSAGPDPMLFLVLCGLCVLVGLWLDYRFAAPKVKTYVAMSAAFTLVFAWYFPQVATPHNLVRHAIEAGLVGLVGLFTGWLASVIVKSFKPKPKKTVR